MYDKIIAILDELGPLLYVIIPTIFGIYFNLREKVKAKEAEVKSVNKAKAKQVYDAWEHDESQNVIRKIKDLCNIYKDKSSCGLAQYLQLENGTMATSKICNMFVSCLAEDGRYGKVPKLSHKIQRVPYAKLTSWINKIIEIKGSASDYILTPDIANADYNFAEIVDAPNVKSLMVAPVYNPNEILLGMCVFYYDEKNFGGHEESEVVLINKFRTGVESVLLEYHMNRQEKKKTLGMDGDLSE